ncbi:MAG: ABC transporter ATP-binding protein [Candidatus Onthomonas sp.]
MGENLKKMLSYYRPYLGTLFADLFFAILAAVISLVIPLVVRYITSTVIYLPPEQAVGDILRLGLALTALVLIQCGSNYFITNFGHVMGARMEYDMRAQLFAHYQRLSFSFYDNQKVGQLMSRITNDLFDITELLHHGPENLIISAIKLVGAFAILLSISPPLALAAFALIPAMIWYAAVLNKKMKRAFRRNREQIAQINAQIEDNLSGIRVVKSFANEAVEEDKFRAGNDGFLSAKRDSYRYMGGYNSGLTAFITMIQVVVIVTGGVGIAQGWVEVTDLVTFLLYINVFTDPVRTLIDFTEQFQNGYTGFERFLEILRIAPEIEDLPGAEPIGEAQGALSFRDVSFHYEDDDRPVLSHIQLDIAPGSYVALVGSSGVGKSTLCNLIPRFYDVTGGAILLDGRDIRSITLESLRRQIGMVQQEVYLFSGTVLENIRYGRPDASREEIIQAAKQANAHDFIMELPNGYDTDIGQRGVKLSGGQKQRLSIARVFLKNPPILIFDEATSALDNESERLVQESLERLAKNRTTLVIAHRLSTIRNAQQILVLTEEGIAEQGSHQQLLDRHGIYEHLYQMQFETSEVCPQ